MKRTLSAFFGAVILAWVSATVFSASAHAEWKMLPESRHQLFQSYSFFIEQHNMLAWKGASHYWAAVATTLPIVGNNDSPVASPSPFASLRERLQCMSMTVAASSRKHSILALE